MSALAGGPEGSDHHAPADHATTALAGDLLWTFRCVCGFKPRFSFRLEGIARAMAQVHSASTHGDGNVHRHVQIATSNEEARPE